MDDKVDAITNKPPPKECVIAKAASEIFMKFQSDFSSVLLPPYIAKSLYNTEQRVNKWSKRGLKKTNQRVENLSF